MISLRWLKDKNMFLRKNNISDKLQNRLQTSIQFSLNIAILVIGLISFTSGLKAQGKLFELSDTLSKPRLWIASATASSTFIATTIGLNEIWYKEFDRSKFHLFNDWNEWNNMDKFGHAFTAYFQNSFSYDVARWTGLKKKPSLIIGASLATIFQGTIEILDAHSEKWGFSVYDIAFNTAGVVLFSGQEILWDDQRFVLKVSNRFPKYNETPIVSNSGNEVSSVAERAEDLFGSAASTRFIKDYNGQTIWLSMNPGSFMSEENNFPKWLNIAIGYGAENLYGGFGNSWNFEDEVYVLSQADYPRARQMFISLDVDLKRIKVRKPFLRFLLKGLNVFKIPSPTLSFTQNKGIKFHPLYW